MTESEAKELCILLMQISGKLDQSVAFVRDKDSETNFLAYRREVGKIMGALLTEIETPLWNRYPSLEPDYLGGPLKTDLEMHKPYFYRSAHENT